MPHINIIIEELPNLEPPNGRIVEIEDEHGRSIAPAAVVRREDGTLLLRIDVPPAAGSAAE